MFIDTSLVERNFITEKLLGWKIHGNFVEQNFAQNFRFGKRPQINVLYDLAILSLSNALNGRVFSHEFVRTERNFIHPDAKIIMGYFQNLRMYSSDQFERYLKLLETIISSKSLQNRTVIHFRWGDSDWAKKHSSYYSKVFEIAKNINGQLFLSLSAKVDWMNVVKFPFHIYISRSNGYIYAIITECWVNCQKQNQRFNDMIKPLILNVSNNSDKINNPKQEDNSIVNQLEKLNDLYKSGVLTKEEFEKAKKRILN